MTLSYFVEIGLLLGFFLEVLEPFEKADRLILILESGFAPLLYIRYTNTQKLPPSPNPSGPTISQAWHIGSDPTSFLTW